MQDTVTSAGGVSVSSQYFTSVSAGQAPGDGTKIIVRALSNKSSAVMRLDGHSANIQYQDGNRIGPALVSGGVYTFVYSSSDTSWKVENPGVWATTAPFEVGSQHGSGHGELLDPPRHDILKQWIGMTPSGRPTGRRLRSARGAMEYSKRSTS